MGDPHWSDISCFKTTRFGLFKDEKEMTKVIIDNVYKLPDNIMLIINGDIFDFDHLQSCCWNKQVKIIMGNHDVDTKGYKLNKIKKMKEQLMFDIEIINNNIYKLEKCDNILISHYPIPKLPDNCLNIHGHYHNMNGYGSYNMFYNTGFWPKNKYYNSCIDYNNLAPVNLRSIFCNMRIFTLPFEEK